MLKVNDMRKVFEYGEVGLDEEASPGNGQFYCQHYESGYDACGFDTMEEAKAELEYYNTMWNHEPWLTGEVEEKSTQLPLFE
jgi:hypothetical protein